MAIIAPFRGVTYHPELWQDLSKLVTPPYDVISEEEQEEYYRSHPYNIIRLILGKRKIGDSDWDNRYTRAADLYGRWQSQGILVRDEMPSMYLTALTYNPGNGVSQKTRWGLIALAKIEDEDSGVILPHEKTFSAHKNDRLKLMRACNAQFSQIFGLYEDADDDILTACKNEASTSPQFSFSFKDGTLHKQWRLESPSLFRMVAEAMAQKAIFIADGHHRYETSRNLRNILRKKHGRRPENKSYDYVMMYLTDMNDEGLTILPAHRLVKGVDGLDVNAFFKSLNNWFDISEFPFSENDISRSCTELSLKLEQEGRQNTAIAFYYHTADRFYIFSLKPGSRQRMGPEIHPSLKALDVLVLSRFVFKEGLGFTPEDMDNSDMFHYQSNMAAAVSEVVSGNCRLAFLLNPTKKEQVIEIAKNALVMPRKSTYFYPKVLTGQVFNKIDPHEIIQTP